MHTGPGLALSQKINKTARADGADASAAAAAAAAPQSFGSRRYSLSKMQSKVPETPGIGKPRGNPNRIKYQSYTGVWVNYTVKKPKKSWF